MLCVLQRKHRDFSSKENELIYLRGLRMEKMEIIRTKNKILCVAFLASIILRCVVNTIFISFSSVIGLGVAGLVMSGLLFLLTWKVKNPVIVEYGMVGVFSLIRLVEASSQSKEAEG